MADLFTFKKKIHDPTVMKPRPFCVKNIQRCIERKTSLLDGYKILKFDDDASRAARYDLMLNGNGETVFQTTDKFQPLPELWAINRAEKMFSDGCSAAVKNKDEHSADKTSMIPVEYILNTFVIKCDDQDLLGNDENTAPHNETSDTHQDVLLCPEVKIVQDIAYEENALDAETVSSELGKECSLQIVEETNGKEMSVTSLPEAKHVILMQAENFTSIQNACQTRRNHGKQRLRQKGRQGRGQGYMRDRAASDCGCQKLFKDSKQYFTNGDMENGYHNLVKVLEFKHWSRQHSKIMSKVTAFIIRKLGETCTDDIPDCLQTLSEATYCMIIRGLVLQKKWIQVNAAFQRFCNINGSETMKTFAIIVNIVEKIVKDKMLKSLEEIKLQTVMLMLDIGVSLDKHDGERLAVHAKVRGHLKVALELLKRDCVGDTPMHAAVMIDLQTDNLNLLEKLLCQFDGDPVKFQFLNPKQVDAKGNGLFHLLAKCKFSNYALEAIKMLCARHLDPRLCNNKGKLPVDYIKNANDERKQYLCIDVCPEVPKLENVSIETKSSANEKVAQIKIEEKTCANIIETVKSSVGRNNLEIIEEMIKNMKKAKCKASKKFKKTLYTVLPERAMCQALMPSDHTESKLETREGDVGTSMEKKERSKSENNVDRYVVNANKGDENKESEYEDEETLDETIDASVFDNLAWEVDCTSEFWKKMRDKHITPDMMLRIIQRIKLLASGEWQPRLCKRLKNIPPNLKLYEAKVSKGGRVIWELAVAFSPRLNEMAAQPVKGGKIYSEIIRIWDIILDHGKLNRSIQRSAKRLIQAQIIGSYERGLTCIIPKTLHRNESLSTHTNHGHSVPILFTENEEEYLDNMLELQQKQLQKYFPHASPNKTEYHILKFYSFNLVSQYVLKNLSTKEPLDLPFRVTDQEHAIISLKSDAPILLLGRSGTGKTICCLYRLCSQFQDYWRKAKEAEAPLLPRTVCFFHLALSEKMKDKEKWDKMKKKEAKKKESEEVWKNDEKKLYMESGPVGVDNPEECTCSQYAHIHQVFVTRNPVLCTMVQKKFKEFCNADIHLDRAAEKLPSRLQDIDEYSYPAFLTSHQLLLMLDASVGAPYFFDRKKDYSLKADLQGWMDTDGSDSIQSLFRKDLDSEMDVSNGSNGFRADVDGAQETVGTQQVDIQEWLDDDGSHSILPLIDQDSNQVEDCISNNGRNSFIEVEDVEQQMSGIKQIKVDPSREVTYEVFVTEVWPHLKKKMKASYDPSLVWTEIMSVIKGSFEALSKPCGYLSKDEYIEVGRKRAPCFSGERENIYKVFTDYNGFIKHKNLFDETDLIHSIFRRLRGMKTIPWVIHQIFVDETQDFTQAELYLLIQICQDPNQMFLTGDTAQSIMRGISFRFEDLKALFFHAQQSMQAMNKREIIKAPEQYQLTHNYRSHMGILSLASSVLDLLEIFFPESFDKLVRDQGLFNGPQPILFESSNFSDLAVLLQGNQRKTSQIEFGAHQTILVANEAARDAVPKELQFGLILTIYEAKGLEFDDVLLYNFFKDSQASKEWRLVTHHMEQMFQDSKESTQGPSTSKKGLVKIYQDLMQQERSRPLTFDFNQHKVLNSELKHLYTALTRARVNLWIFDEDVEKRTPMFEYFKSKNLVRCLTLDETDKSKLINMVFAEGSSADDWKCRGSYFMKHSLYEAAAKCFEISGETSNQKAALAHHIALAAGKMRGNPQDMKKEFLQAAKLFLECNLPTKAAICLQNARERELAAQLYKNIGQFEKAAKTYYKLNNASESSRCLEISGNFNLAIQVLCKSENYDSAIDSLRRYAVKRKEFESRGDQIPQILIDCDPFKNFSEEYLNIMLADFHHRHNNHNKMMLTLERLPCWKDRVEFLKEKGHVDEAIQILEENEG